MKIAGKNHRFFNGHGIFAKFPNGGDVPIS